MPDKTERYIDKVAELVRGAGYRSVVDGTSPVINSSANGFNFIIIVFDDDEGLQFHCSIAVDKPADSLLSDINRYNSRFRYMKIFYEYDVKQLVLQNDYFFDASGQNSSVIFERMIHVYDAAITSLKELIVIHNADDGVEISGSDATGS
ncbi:MAG: hypothetical protein ACOH2R_28680 [Pseudomonas sp.]